MDFFVRAAVSTAIAVVLTAGHCAAQTDAPPPPQHRPQHYEISAGGEAGRDAWSVHVTATTALGGDVCQPGFRLRSSAGYGTYSYDSAQWTKKTVVLRHYQGVQAFADAMLGYHAQIGALTVKAYAGAAMASHMLTPADPENVVYGERVGLKLALETWFAIGARGFVQSDTSWQSAFDAYASRLRVGYRVLPNLAIGPELAVFGNTAYDGGRAGAFIRFEFGRGEISASAGASGDKDGADGAYGTLGGLFRF